MTRRRGAGHEPLADDEDPVEDDLDRAELVESASFQNTWSIIGPAALLLVPLATGLAAIQKLLSRRRT